jgi:hypothetical protein
MLGFGGYATIFRAVRAACGVWAAIHRHSLAVALDRDGPPGWRGRKGPRGSTLAAATWPQQTPGWPPSWPSSTAKGAASSARGRAALSERSLAKRRPAQETAANRPQPASSGRAGLWLAVLDEGGIAARVRRECAAQGVPERVKDLAVLAKVVTLAYEGQVMLSRSP